MKVRLMAVAVVLAGVSPFVRGEDVLVGLRAGHPRLMVLEEDVARLKGAIRTDAVARGYFERVREVGDGLLATPVSERVLEGPRLLRVSRQVVARVATLGGLYRVTGERKYADRCRDEMLAAARFVDWNPSHFLDTAEMTNGLAIGYDWIYDALAAGERAEIRTAIVEKGLKPGLAVYGSAKGWHQRTNNWNQVCNGGLTVGALAVADEEPAVARRVIEEGRRSMPLAMGQFAPDGGCVEGPGYWGYATQYTVYYLAALRTALGTDFGFAASPGFAETGTFRVHAIGPSGRTFNFADSNDGVGPTPQMFWMARALGRPEYAAHERGIVGGLGKGAVDAFHLMWYEPVGTARHIERIGTGALFRRIDVAFLRTGWGKAAGFVGFKGGDNAASHAHLDLGSFVYDAGGVRWAMDLGPDDYNLPGYFGGKRWGYYRLSTEGQNALTIGGPNQDPKGTAEVVAFSAGPERRFAVADLSKAYGADVKRAVRGVELFRDGRLRVQDEVEAAGPVEVVWHMHTRAKIGLREGAKVAVLEQGGKKMMARVVSPEGARFEVAESDRPPGVESTVPTGRERKTGEKLVVRMPDKVKDVTLVVELVPDGARVGGAEVVPLARWGGNVAKGD
jgi:hypothetical protein